MFWRLLKIWKLMSNLTNLWYDHATYIHLISFFLILRISQTPEASGLMALDWILNYSFSHILIVTVIILITQFSQSNIMYDYKSFCCYYFVYAILFFSGRDWYHKYTSLCQSFWRNRWKGIMKSEYFVY